MISSNAALFTQEVFRLRADYEHRRATTNLVPPGGRHILESDIHYNNHRYSLTYWYEDGTEHGQCVRIFEVADTLSGDILRLTCNLPESIGDSHCEIDGNEVRFLDRCPNWPPPLEDDSEDVSDLVLSKLPLVSVDPDKHFLKKCRYRSEIENLIKCQGGSVPGRPLSPNVVQLLGRSSDGELVFEKLTRWPWIIGRTVSLTLYKSWLLQLIDGLESLHSIGIIHRDLKTHNLVFSEDGTRLVICDLEGRWGSWDAPELDFNAGFEDRAWSTRSDIYDIGNIIKCMVYSDWPITPWVEWPVPPPLDVIVEACMRPKPENRATLMELRAMISNIQTEVAVNSASSLSLSSSLVSS